LFEFLLLVGFFFLLLYFVIGIMVTDSFIITSMEEENRVDWLAAVIVFLFWGYFCLEKKIKKGV
jgi:hypothetical protein